MERQWYYTMDGNRHGPVADSPFRSLASSGAIPQTALVWSDGMPEWIPLSASHLSGLAPQMPSAPPPMVDTRSGPGRPMDFGTAIQSCFANYVGFSGRASRSEMWFFALFYLLALLLAVFLDAVLFGSIGPFYVICSLALCLPLLAVQIRRLHDIDRSGWWILISAVPLIGVIILLIFFCTEAKPGPNRFS